MQAGGISCGGDKTGATHSWVAPTLSNMPQKKRSYNKGGTNDNTNANTITKTNRTMPRLVSSLHRILAVCLRNSNASLVWKILSELGLLLGNSQYSVLFRRIIPFGSWHITLMQRGV